MATTFAQTKAAPVARTRAGDWDRFAIIGCALVGVIVGIAQARGLIHEPFDAAFYWRATMPFPYHEGVGAYVYPPVLAQLLEPARAIGWEPFIVAWTTLLWASLGYLAGRWTPVVIAAVFVPGGAALGLWSPLEAALIGNVTLPMTAAIVLGMRHPGWWAVPLLSKMTVGVGVLWFAFRGEWRRFGIALGTTALVVAVSFVLAPSAWWDFAQLGMANAGANANGMMIVGPPLPLRLGAAVLLIAWGARTNRPWVVPIACGISLIGLYGLGSVTPIALGALRLRVPHHLPLDPDERREGVEQRPVAGVLREGDELRL